MMFALVQSLGWSDSGEKNRGYVAMTVNKPMGNIVFVHELHPLVH